MKLDKTFYRSASLVYYYFKISENLRSLADMLSEFPSLVQNSRFVFVPGPRDPGPAHILPRYSVKSRLSLLYC